MRIENAFEVEAAPDEVYALMLDPAHIATSFPGPDSTPIALP